LTRVRRGERFSTGLAITTPTPLLRAEATAPILRDASLGLASLDPTLSAKAGLTPAQRGFAMTAIAGATFALGLAPLPALVFMSLSMTCFFLASIWLRLFAGAAQCDRLSAQQARHQARDRAGRPREAARNRGLASARNLRDRRRAGWLAKDETPRAEHCLAAVARRIPCIFDAEDAPAPGQLCEAAERFLRSPRELACLQARLAIDNIEDSWLTRLFAIEYAVLFDVLNPGLAGPGLPLPLGGSSNHFRTAVLREVCGCDAWNVTAKATTAVKRTSE
jgi:hypothetical protein